MNTNEEDHSSNSDGISNRDQLVGGDGAVTAEQRPEQDHLQWAEEALDDKEEELRSAKYKLRQIKSELRSHGINPDDLIDGVAEPGKLKELQVASCNRTRLRWKDFPLGVLPDPVQRYVEAQSQAMCVDPAMIGVPALPVLASAVGNSRHLRIKSNWEEPPTLWAILVGASGSLKSPSLNKALKPAHREEHELRDQWENQLDEWEAKDREERDEKPRRERRTVNDITVESVAVVHDDNPRGLLMYRDELAAWLGSFNQYNRGDSDLPKWCEFWDSVPVQIDRKSSDRPSTLIPKPSVSVVGSIQPEVLEDRFGEHHFQSGFAARCLMCKPPEQPRRLNDHGVTREVKNGFSSLVSGLYDLRGPDADSDVGGYLELSGEAWDVYEEFFNECERLKEKLGDGPLRSLVAKNQAVGVRLALTFQLCEDSGSDQVGRDAMIAGTTLARWLRRETARIYQRHGFHERGVSEERRRARWLPTGTFGVEKIEEVWDCSQRTAYNVKDRLMERGLLRMEEQGQYRSLIAEGEVDPYEHFA
jgi:hypothetical protein